MPTQAQTRRSREINAILTDYTTGAFKDDRETIATAIDLLAEYGRTERWQATVKRWAALVRDDSNPLQWAVLQGGIWASWASE